MTLETILRTVLHAAAGSAFVAFCGVATGVGVRWMLRMLGRALAETGHRCGKWASMTFASLALVCAVIAQKANTNDAPGGVSAPAPMMSAARGAPETCLQNPTNAPETFPPRFAAQRPANAQDVEEWELRGAYDDAIRISATNSFFRTPDGFVEGLTVFSRGEFRPDIGHLYFPRPPIPVWGGMSMALVNGSISVMLKIYVRWLLYRAFTTLPMLVWEKTGDPDKVFDCVERLKEKYTRRSAQCRMDPDRHRREIIES